MIVWLSRDDVRRLKHIEEDVHATRAAVEGIRTETVALRKVLERIATAVEQQPPPRVPTGIVFRAGTPVRED